MEAAAAESAAARALARIKRGVAVLVISRAFLRVAQGLVSFAEFLELFLGRFVARIFVRVKFHGELAVGFFISSSLAPRLTPRIS